MAEFSNSSRHAEWVSSQVESLSSDLSIDSELLMAKIIAGIPPSATDEDILELASETAASLTTQHPDYSTLAGRLLVENIYQQVPHGFSEAMSRLYAEGILAPDTWDFIHRHKTALDNAIDEMCDKTWSYFGIQTLRKSYLLRRSGLDLAERPQHLFMRVSVGIHGRGTIEDDHQALELVLETYRLMSQRFFIHATPTLFNSGLKRSQMASCFIVAMKDDSVEGIFETLKDCAQISKYAGGIGMHVSNIRAARSLIKSSGGTAGGLLPMLRVFNNAARFVDQGGNRRPGAISITLEPWHADILPFLQLKKNHGKEEYRARDLFYALWVPDMFMEYVQENKDWHLFSPDRAPGLQDAYGEEFVALYLKYVAEKRYQTVMPAQTLWNAILDAQIETGNPSILYKDSCNRKSNQKNLGTIKSSNLCTEIIEYSSPEETAVCNLASLALPKFVKFDEDEPVVDYELLHSTTKVVVRNLNKIIDINDYPTPESQRSNLRHRPVSVGVQGLADLYILLNLPYDSQEAQEINEKVFATIYHGALEMSAELAQVDGPYETFDGSPASKGLLQFDLWSDGKEKGGALPPEDLPWDWDKLRQSIAQHKLRNSLLTGIMPTASTSQILGFSESTEPLTSNLYTRRTLSGEFQIVNAKLVEELEALDMWSADTKAFIIASNGSIQGLPGVPARLKEVFKTVWELSQRAIIDQNAGRGPFIDQSQSMNIFLSSPTRRQLTSMHFYGWSQGLKTGLYYLRTLAAQGPIQYTITQETIAKSRSMTPQPSTPPPQKRIRSDECDVCSA